MVYAYKITWQLKKISFQYNELLGKVAKSYHEISKDILMQFFSFSFYLGVVIYIYRLEGL